MRWLRKHKTLRLSSFWHFLGLTLKPRHEFASVFFSARKSQKTPELGLFLAMDGRLQRILPFCLTVVFAFEQALAKPMCFVGLSFEPLTALQVGSILNEVTLVVTIL